MRCRLRSLRFAVSEAEARLPFRFGIAVMTRAPILVLEAVLEAEDGTSARGHAAETLVPKWFDKNPATTRDQDLAALVAAARRAADAWLRAGAVARRVFEQWRTVEHTVPGADVADPSAGLVRGFGIALVERAVIDAACRVARVSFQDALAGDLLGAEFGRLSRELDGWSTRALDRSAATERPTLRIRHTIGLADALRHDEVPAESRRDDGHPTCLADDLREYGLRSFKIKLHGRRDLDLLRLESIGALLDQAGVIPDEVTLDGNENFADACEVVALFEDLARSPAGARLLARVTHVEQPLPRARSFAPDATRALADLAAFAPCIIDEADGDQDAFSRALEAGYRGVSVKGCKGVFRALFHAGLCARRRRDGVTAFQSAEDLTCLGVVGLQEDLALDLLLGLAHTERNGHHYFAGLAHLPEPERERALERHPDLYERGPRGPRLRIRNGVIETTSLRAAIGFGHDVPPDLALRTPLAAWTPTGS